MEKILKIIENLRRFLLYLGVNRLKISKIPKNLINIFVEKMKIKKEFCKLIL